MKFLKSTILVILLGTIGVNVSAQTSISGNITTNTTWTTAGSPYVIVGSTTITNGDTLTIEDGVEVKFDNGTQLTVSGALVGNGVTFTGNTGTSRGAWNRIITNFEDSWIHLRNSTLQFATDAIYVGAGEVRLDTVTISDSNRGVTITQNTNTTINGSTITNNEYPINIASEGYIEYEGNNDFTGNDNDVVYLSHQSNIDVNFTLENPGIPYLPNTSKYVTTGDTLTVMPGVIIKFNQSNELYTHDGGVIIAEGTQTEPIYFTSNRNDNIGGDTNNDGTASSAGNQDWYGLRIVGKTRSSSFKHVRVSFAGYQFINLNSQDVRGGITLIENDSKIDSSTFQNNLYGISLRDSSDATITNNTIGSSGVVPVALTFDSEPVFTNNSFSSANNEYDAIGLIGTTITGTNYLPKRNFTSIPNVTYLLLSELFVDTGASLEIEPGVVIKSTGSGIRVKGTLNSDGTVTDPIIFTSVKDDNVGNPNDTNKDGNNTVPGNRDWRGIALGEDSDASVIDYNEIRYAYYNTNFQYGSSGSIIYPRGALNLYNADVSITNSDIGNTYEFAIDSRGTSAPAISNNSFTNTGSVPVALDLSSDPTFSGNTLANASLVAIGYHGGTFNNDGIIRARTFAGYDNITSVLLSDITIASGTKLTIEPGTVIKSQSGPYGGLTLRVEGVLDAAGTPDSLIYFTSIFDDQVGNPLDTNNDGGGSSPGAYNWGAIRFMGTSDDALSEISNAELRYGRHGVIFTDAAPTIDNVTVLSCGLYGFGIESGSTVSINNSTIQNCGWEPIAISSNALPTFSGNTFNGNGSNAVGILEANTFHSSSGVNQGDKFFDTRETISSDVTISPYTVAGFTNIPFITRNRWTVGANATVSIDPLSVFKGDDVLYVDGALRVLGTETEPVIFTSYNDDSAGGDSNNDGNNTVPSPGQSAQIQFRASSLDSANLVKNTEFRYPGNPIRFINAGGTIDSSLIQLTSGDAIDISGNSDPVITNNRFENIGAPSGFSRRHSVYMDMFSNPTFSGNVESNVSLRGLAIKGGTWGSDGIVPFRSFAGIDSITYHMTAAVTIPSGSKITIPDGMVFKRETQYGASRKSFNMFTVKGALEVAGTDSNPVIFTSDTDDSYGQPADIYGNGSVDENDDYKSGNWIIYNATSNDTSNIINHAVFKYGNETIVANSANPTINNSRFEKNQYGISLTGVSAPFVENNTFHDLDFTPLLISLVSYPQAVSGNEMSGSTYKAIGVRTETLVQDITLEKRNFAGKVGIPYFFTGTYTVGTGAVLTIAPGVVNKFNVSRQLNVQKGLIAEGGSTPDSMIIFTSIYDDFYGGDTNADSNATKPQPGNWLGIKYEGTSLPGVSSLNHTIIKHARGGSSYAGVLADNSSPTISNSIIAENDRGIMVYGSGNPSITNSDISGNTEYGIFNRDKTFTINATNNWWGNNSGPTHTTNPSGTGDEVSDGVDFGAFTGSGASNPVLGDVSLNGKVQSFDAAKLLRVAALIDTLNATQLKVADVSGNGTVSAMDASYVLQYVVGLIEAFPAELNSKERFDMNSIEGTEDMILTLGNPVSASETEFTVSINIDNVSKLYSSEISIAFDENNLELIGSNISRTFDNAMVSENKGSRGRYSLAIASGEPVSENGEIATLTFKLKDENSSPSISIDRFQANEVDLITTSVGNEDLSLNIPDQFQLYQNYPNPFNPSTTIGFDVPNGKTQVRLEIYNILGQRVKTLVNDVYSAGRYKVTWDGTNNVGGRVSTGVYIYRMQAGDIVQSKKLTFIK